MRKTCLLMFAAAMSGLTGMAMAATAPAWSLIPQPALAHPAAHGVVTIADGDTVRVKADGNPQATAIATRFAARVASTRGLHLDVVSTPDASTRIVFQLDATADTQSDAGYRIHIGDGKIRITARTPRGLFYGAVTTWQLLTDDPTAHGPAQVANGRIADHPRYRWRGLMLDSARHFQSVAEIKKLIDWMALHKLDVLHWHLTDDQGWRLQIKRYPKLTSMGSCRKALGPDAALTGGPEQPYCGFYTQAEVRDLVRYAAARFITIVPEIDLPGHAQAALHAYPQLGVTGKRPPVSTDWGINPWLYAPNQRSITFLENVLDEVMALFPSPYIHIGGDEAIKTQWKHSPTLQAKLKRLDLKDMNALQNRMMSTLGAYLAKHGRTMVGWDEIMDAKLPPDAVVMSWHGVKGGLKAAAMGHDAVLSPSPVLYLDHVQSSAHDEPAGRPQVESLKDIYTFNPSPASLSDAQAHHILGVQANLWTEYMPTFARAEHAVFPRMAAWAEVAWSPASAIDWDGFIERMTAQVARYQALGIAYADSAWAPRFTLAAGDDGKITVRLSNQVDRGTLHYTEDGSTPTARSPRYSAPLSLPADHTTTLKVATYASDGLRLAAPRTRTINAESLLTRNSDQLATCSHMIALRIEDDRPLKGPRPVYKVDIGNTCWTWNHAPMDGVHTIAIRVGNLPFNYAIPYVHDKVTTRPEATPGGEINVHLDTCTGPRIARLPLARAAKTRGQTTLRAQLPTLHGQHDLCFVATGDPRQGRIWAIDTVTLSPATN